MEAEATQRASVPTAVVVEPGRASAPVVLGAVDAALRSGIAGLSVLVPLAADDPRRATVATACAADGRIEVTEPGATPAAPGVVVELPARARTQPHTLSAVTALLANEGLARVEVPMPGRAGVLGRARLVAHGSGEGTRKLRPGLVGLRSVTSSGETGPPPKGTLAEERAEHLRHRARASTMRARMSRNLHRLSRERLQTRHERTRRGLAERRLGTSSAGEWVRWRSRAVARRAASVPAAVAAGGRSVRNITRRARRFAVDRVRSRRLD